MVLKININGSTKALSSPGHPPITFINGTKKPLVKGITFINGQKRVLWEAHKMQIDYVWGMEGIWGYIPSVVCAARDKMVLTGKEKIISRINIANLSAPFLDASVANGLITSYSKMDSAGNNLIFYACVPGDKNNQATFNQISIDSFTLSVSVTDTYNWSYRYTVNGAVAPVKMGADWWAISRSTTAVVYINQNKGYDFTQYSSTQRNKINSTLIKLNNSECVGVLFETSNRGLGQYTSSGVTPLVSDKNYRSCLICNDGNYLAAGPSGIGLYKPDGGLIKYISPVTGYNYSIIGQIRQNYYIVEEPAPSDAPTAGVKVIVLNTDGTIKEYRPLNLEVIPDSAANVNPYGSHVNVIPHISKNGFLGFYWNAYIGYIRPQDCLVRIEGY